ncbi:DASH complex subunit Ask1-domain-containing protein [Clohesyomyces aquaticus]|uniref:DASH complex subunit ASK1 n=1 Tax=Clohesyomyces aquaticus TaxID=1231657 RepID=A0A1Y2A7W3_9PLEO|nr:DASH complex subunit Ask1-domain-containing protein [Clohesyomyces aquaticus]
MSRQSVAPQRALTLTEELEKLEQSITLTLQEIDHNFSRAHRIVTTSVLPVVEQYGKHSEAVWEGSKAQFWKQFFEASANVSLSGYEDPGQDESTAHEETQDSQLYDDQTVEDTVTGATATPPKASSSQADDDFGDTSTLDSPLEHAHSTPRAPNTGGGDPKFADFSSPYEKLKRELEGARTPGVDPTTPGKTHNLPDMSMTPESSPFVPPTTTKKTVHINQDPLLHRVLDKTYRIQATPHSTARKQKKPVGFTPGTASKGRPALSRWAEDSSPPSSPAPQLRADIFSSPLKAPRTPGVSVQTPGRGKQAYNVTQTKGVFDSDSEDEGEDEELGFSPPKTMQFHIPQSRLLQTPAREASKRIVEDLLLTAGGDITDDFDGEEEDSPSVVRRQIDLDDSF